mmetsp:Transcript_37241/g.116424  ORF Transcript_37241/g.116424 Transcript_37241/m.116424 type:complete len:104 (-) Transcript_37241:808-1119(-)
MHSCDAARTAPQRTNNASTHPIPQEYLGALSGLEGQELVDAFMKIASESSDCSSFRNGGNLGEFGPGMMQKPFEDASFGLEVGGMTPDIVDTDSGVHLVLRLA